MRRLMVVPAVILASVLCSAAAARATCTLVPLSPGTPDAEGKRVMTFVLPEPRAFTIYKHPTPMHSSVYCASVPAGYRITKVRSFVGVDHGGKAEVALDVSADGQVLMSRSEHFYGTTSYDAWKSEPTDHNTGNYPKAIFFYVRAWATTTEPTKFEAGLVLEVRPVPPAYTCTEISCIN